MTISRTARSGPTTARSTAGSGAMPIDACDRCLALSELTARLCSVPLLRGSAEWLDARPPAPTDDATATERIRPAKPRKAPLLASADGLAPVPGELVLAAEGVSAERATELARRYEGWSADGFRAYIAANDIAAFCKCSSDYPESVRPLSDTPYVLYARGDLAVLDRCPDVAIAMVGTRRPTRVGREAARTIAAGIAQTGGVVVSGMALGIDGAAHDGALSVRGTTVAVLAGGVDRPSPPSHAALYERILESGVVVSELPPGTQPSRWSFPARNRIIAALSSAVIVVEAPMKSGALITVDHAQDLGIEVLAVPGSIASPTCHGSNQLLCEGAGGVVDGIELMATRMAVGAALRPVDADHGRIHDALRFGARSRHEIATGSGLGARELDLALIDLELSGWIERGLDGRYRLAEQSNACPGTSPAGRAA